MKGLIVAFHPRTMTPYSKQYEEAALACNNQYDIIFWDRFSNGPLEKIKNEYWIHKVCTLGGSKLKKIPAMLYFRRTVKHIIQMGGYDRIVILNTLPGVLLSDVLLNDFSGRYVLDIRDYTYEKYDIYRKRVNRLIDNSFLSTISSEGFYSFVDHSPKIFLNHNISNIDQRVYATKNLRNCSSLNIGYVGAVRYEKENEALIDAFANNPDYEICYYGRFNEGCYLDRYCSDKGISNVKFFGPFDNSQKPEIYSHIDIINSLYGNQTLDVSYAIPNRFYDAALFQKPLIVSDGTYLTQMVERYQLGVVIHDVRNIYSDVTSYCKNFNVQAFSSNCSVLLEEVSKDISNLNNKLINFMQ